MKSLTPLLLALVMLTGCAYHAKHYAAPDASAVIAAASQLRTTVVKAKATAARAQAEVVEVAQDADDEGQIIVADASKLTDLLKAAPPELRDAITAIQKDNSDLAAKHADLAAKLADVQKVQGVHALEMEKEIPAAEDHLSTVDDTYMKAANERNEQLNTDETKIAQLSAENLNLKTHSLLFKLACGLGLLAVAALIFLWFTGRLALAGASIAAKIP